MERDRKNTALLTEMGWHVLVVWECELKKKTIDDTLQRVARQIRENLPAKEKEQKASDSPLLPLEP